MDIEHLSPGEWGRFVGLRVLLLAVASVFARFVYNGYVARRRFRRLQAEGVPMLPHSWIWGHLPLLMQFGKKRPADTNALHITNFLMDNYAELSPGHGDKPVPPVFYLDVWPVNEPMMIVVDSDLAAQFTQDPSPLPKHRAYQAIVGPLTGGEDLLASRGEFWKFWRPRFNPGFRPKVLQALIPDLLEEALVFLDVLERRVGPNGTWGEVYPLEADTINLTFDTIARATFNVRMNEQSGRPGAFRAAMEQQGGLMEMGLNPLQIFHPINPVRQWRLYRNEREMRSFLRAAVHNREKAMKSSSKQFIVDAVLGAREEDLSPATGRQDLLSNEAYLHGVVQNLKIVLFAGHDTTATTICRCFHLLEQHPDSMARLRAEHDAVLGPNPAEAAATLRSRPHLLNALPYTTAVIKEVLRLHPPGMSLREGRRGHDLHKPGYPPLPTAGFVLWDAMQGSQRNPEFWRRPAEYLPERFTAAEGDPLHPRRNAWRAFAHPPRSCIGQDLAMTEMKLVLVLVCRRYELRVAWDEWDRLHPGPGKRETVNGERLYATGATTVHLKDGMPVQARRLTQC